MVHNAACRYFVQRHKALHCDVLFPEVCLMHVLYGLVCFQVAKKLVKEAESNIGKKEYDANDGLVRHSDATKIQVMPRTLTFSILTHSQTHTLHTDTLAHSHFQHVTHALLTSMLNANLCVGQLSSCTSSLSAHSNSTC